jgi:hypothetical protein
MAVTFLLKSHENGGRNSSAQGAEVDPRLGRKFV